MRSRVPQGSILSPIIFTIYCAVLQEWVKHLTLLNFADDTSTSHSEKNTNPVITNLEEDTRGVLKFMASNGLVANPSKIDFMLISKRKAMI